MRSPVTSTAALPQPAILGVLQASFPGGASRSLAIWGSVGRPGSAPAPSSVAAHNGVVAADLRHQRPAHPPGRPGRCPVAQLNPRPHHRALPAGVRLDARHRHRAHTRPSPTILFGPSSAAEGASNPSSPASRPGDPHPADPAP